ncbi:MAG TPA: YSC84-related protein [Terriglobales bacterium]|nr:YSC84-related protein [Terriglobales bacterium]
MRLKTKILGVLTATMLASTMAVAAEEPSEQVKRMDAAATVLDEIMGTPDKGIPEQLLGSAKCMAVIPSMVKIGFVFGGRHGRGIATCRTATGWSAPAPFSVTGGSWGLQIGGEAIDVVMLVMNDQGMEKMLSSKFKIGADASAAAGPVGRHVEGTTDWKMRAEVLTYSRARGAFAGVTVNGASISQDKDGTRILYGRMVPSAQILKGQVKAPEGSHNFLATVRKYGNEASSVEASDRRQKSDSTRASSSIKTKGVIEEKLKSEPGLDSKDIQVTLTPNVVTLSGSVANPDDRDKAVSIARSYAGDREVKDHLSVQRPD